MATLPITNVINISAATAQAGVNQFNTSNMAIFTDDCPQDAVLTIVFGGTAASGSFTLAFGGNNTSSIAYNATLATITADILAVSGMSNVSVTGSISSGITITQPGVLGSILACTVTANTLQTSGSVAVTVTPTVTNAGWSGGSAGYAIYLSPTQAQLDFGTGSKTAQMVTSMFSQQPNMLAGNGAVIVIPFAVNVQTLSFNATPTSGAYEITWNSLTTTSISTLTAAAAQTALQALTGLSQVRVTGSIVSGGALKVWFFGQYGVSSQVLGSTSNTLSPTTVITQATVATGESWGTAITRTQSLVSYLGNCVNELADTIGSTDVLAAAAIIQALNYSCLGFVVSNNSTDVASSGMASQISGASDSCTRFLYYGDTTTVGGIAGINALLFMASYCGLALSTNFAGSNTTQTMHLKSLSTVNADPTITQTILNNCILYGADAYPSLQGVAKVFCSGANQYFDQAYNLCWFITSLSVAGFNYLAQSSTKVPQTEPGMDGLKTAYRAVCEQAVSNQYLAAGTWTSSTTFGVQADFINNIKQRGYYIYSAPVAQQSAAARAARQAPLVQIAAKQAGAIQSSTVVVYVNA
jgi:hypothetical protein